MFPVAWILVAFIGENLLAPVIAIMAVIVIVLPIIATIQAIAQHNGSELKSTEAHYPIELCNGCLVRDVGACPTSENPVDFSSNDCGLPQDAAVVCCTDSVAGFHCLKTSELPSK